VTYKNPNTIKQKLIPVSAPFISDLEVEYAARAVKSGFISGSSGEYITQFEELFAKFCNTKFGVSCASGTAALQLAVRAAGIKSGDEVIVPTFTNIASVLCVIYAGAKPVLVDAREDTWCMDERLVNEKLTMRTRAIIPVHIYGHPVKMDTIMDIAKERNLVVIEDAAEAHGGLFNGKVLGGIGDMGCFSFYANKIITTGEGGMIVTNNAKYAEKMKSLRNLAFGDVKRYLHIDLGYNYRLTNVQAAIGVAQMQRVNEFVEKKREIASWYNGALGKIDGVTLPCEMPWAKNVYWMYGILIGDEFGLGRDELMKKLREKGIDTRSFFVPMQNQPVFNSLGLFKNDKCPVSDRISKMGLYLPSGIGLTRKEVDYVCNVIKDLSK